LDFGLTEETSVLKIIVTGQWSCLLDLWRSLEPFLDFDFDFGLKSKIQNRQSYK
jgi:hypothetical protein